MRVAVGGLVRDRLPQLEVYLRHLRALDAGGHELEFVFLLDNCAPEVARAVADSFPQARLLVIHDGGQPYDRERGWRPFARMAWLRNLLRGHVLQKGYDAFLSVDTDVVVVPELLTCLLETGRPWVAAIVDNSRGRRAAFNMMFHRDAFPGHYERRPLDFEKGGPAEMVGAACLYRREALARVEYLDDGRGEDVGFARSAAEAGIGGWYVPLELDHLMTQVQLDAHLEGCSLCGRRAEPIDGRRASVAR